MSTIRTVNIQHPSSSTPSITMDSTGAMTGSFPYPNRNLIYNGAMQIHQRSTSVANITSGTYYTADRWNLGITNLGTWTQTIENDAPTGSGFRKSLKMLCTTADPSLAASDLCYFFQRLEGQDCQRIAKGTANAQSLSLSFWVKANVTGTYIARIYDIDNARSISSTYTITANATWERKTITFLPDTTGVFDNDASASLELQFFFAVGTDYTSGTLQTTWGSAVASTAAPGQVNLASTVNNYWQITGVQLEASPVATPFEFKSFGQELRECQRYFQLINSAAGKASSTTAVQFALQFMTEMRTDVSAITSTTARITDVTVSDFTTSNAAAVIQNAGSRGARVIINNFSGLTAGSTYLLLPSGANSAPLQLSAEL